jgi:hypothetical protein
MTGIEEKTTRLAFLKQELEQMSKDITKTLNYKETVSNTDILNISSTISCIYRYKHTVYIHAIMSVLKVKIVSQQV